MIIICYMTNQKGRFNFEVLKVVWLIIKTLIDNRLVSWA